MARSIVNASIKGAELTHRLLAFSRQQALQPEVFQAGKLCAGLYDLLRRSLGETIEIDMTIQEDLWPVLAEPGEVESALLNLAINARHAMPGDGRLEIKIENAPVESQELVERWDGNVRRCS